MNPESTPPSIQPGAGSIPSRPPKRRSWLLYIVGGFLVFLLVIVASVAITLWWIQRPIKPVVLSAAEKATVEQKLEHLEAPGKVTAPNGAGLKPNPEPDRPYAPGSKELQLTERELNGLLNANTDLGQTVRLELGQDAINAYLAVPIPQDFPVGGGKDVPRARPFPSVTQ